MSPVVKLCEYGVTCIGGLEEVAADELRCRFGARIRGLRIEKGAASCAWFRYGASPSRRLDLSCPTGLQAVAAQAHDVTVGRPGLERVLRCLHRLPLEAVARIACACDPSTEPGAYDLRVRVRGAHRFDAREVRARAHEILRGRHGLRAPRRGELGLRLLIQVHGRGALVTVRIGPRRPVGDPVREGWPGPAAGSVARRLDLQPGQRLLAVPGTAGDSVRLGTPEGGGGVTGAHRRRLPLSTGCVGAALAVPEMAAVDDRLRSELAEHARVVTPGGVVALLARRADHLALRLREADLPLEVLACLPYYLRRRRRALFLLERLKLLALA